MKTEDLRMAQEKYDPRSVSISVQNRDPIEADGGSESIFPGISLPLLLVGNDLCLRRYTRQAAELFQLEASDTHSDISRLKLNIPSLDKLAAQVIKTRNLLETEIQCRDGHWYLVRIEPHLIAAGVSDGAVILLIDIDRSKRTERELEGLNETLQALFHSAPDAVLTVDGEGRIMRVNSQTESMFGYSSVELVGKRIETLMPARFKARHIHHRADYLVNRRLRLMGAGLDLYGRRKDGTEFPPPSLGQVVSPVV